MNNESKRHLNTSPNVFIFHWAVALFLTASLICLQGCNKSDAGGTTGGNPLDSSLPQKVSADVE